MSLSVTSNAKLRKYHLSFFYACGKHKADIESDRYIKHLPQSDVAPRTEWPHVTDYPKCCIPECEEEPARIYGAACCHERLNAYFDERTRTINKVCWLCRYRFNVSHDEAKQQFVEHDCGGILAKWVDPNTFNLRVDCTKCNLSERRSLEDGTLLS